MSTGSAALAVAEQEDDTGVVVTAPVLRDVSRRAAARPKPVTGWPERDEIATLQDEADEMALARVIGRTAPNAGREEVLFRYHLSRTIYLGGHELPPLPHSSARILELSRSTKTGIKDYARVVETDPSLVRSVLWLANSSYYAALSKCTGLAQAMVRIGIREVERLALMQAFQARVFKVYGQDELVSSLASHGLATALAAQAVARHTGAEPADAFLGGLFHDVGKLVVLGEVAQVQRQLKRRAPQALIQSAFNAFHVAVGESACRHWELPEPLVQAVAHHQDSDLAAGDGLDCSVYLGNRLAHSLPVKGPVNVVGADDVAAQAAGLDQAGLAELREQVAKELAEYQRLFG